MGSEVILTLAMVALAVSILFFKNRIPSVLIYGVISTLAVVLFSFYAAPDVALAEASIGLVFTIFLYMVVLQHKGKLWAAFIRVDDSIDYLELEILEDYCKKNDLELKVVYSDLPKTLEMLKEGRIDVAAGAFTEEIADLKLTVGFLETKTIYFGTPAHSTFLGGMNDLKSAAEAFENGEIDGFTVDLMRYRHSLFGHEIESVPSDEKNGVFYSLAVVGDDPERMDSIDSYLKMSKETGRLDGMVKEHIR